MVVYTPHSFRPAIAMIELIFALVVMGIVLMSAPALISTANKSSYIAIQQESINEAATQVNIVLTYPWDEANAAQLDSGKLSSILNTDSNVSELNITASADRRAGTPSESYRVKDVNATAATISTSLGTDSNDIDDIDDFHNITITLKEETESNLSDYIEKGGAIKMKTTVSYMNDGTILSYNDSNITFNPFINNNLSTNIKHIAMTLTSTSTSSELNKSITMHAFSCNIGSYVLKER